MGAAAGPLVTLAATITGCTVTATWVLPTFGRWLNDLELPAPAGFALSRAVMSTVFGPAGALLLALVFVTAIVALRSGALAQWSFRSRAIAAPARAAALRTLAISLECELPPGDALELAAAVVAHPYASQQLRSVIRASREGAGLWQLLARSRIIPVQLLTSVRAASGQTISAAIGGLADYFHVEARAGSSSMRTLLSTTVTVVSATLCIWLTITIATGYAAILG